MKTSIFFTALFFSSISFAAIHFENAKEGGEVNFLAVGKPAMIKIKGNASSPKTLASIEKNNLSVESELSLENLHTGIDLRDEHMKKNYLQVNEFPKAKLKIEAISLPDNFDMSTVLIVGQPFQGKLMLHGKEQIVSGLFSLKNKGELSAHFSIKLTDFGIEIPSYLGINVADTVNIDTKFNLVRKSN